MDVDNPLRTLFRDTSIGLILLIGAVLFLFPEPFTSLLGMALILLALLWAGWGRYRAEST